jgi:PAS domain S-box-containing protein
MKTPPRILIVEDERLISLDLSRRLPKLGYEVCGIVPTGEEAVQKAGELRPDLVLMDICLRGEMDGIQAAEIIRETVDLPVMYLSANSDEATLSRAKLSHPSSYLLKPFKERELQIGIDMALLNHGLNTELRAAQENLERRVIERTEELARVNDALRIEVDVRKRMEAQAREQADLLAKARDAIYVRDLAGFISYWNRSAERLYGILAADAIGQRAQFVLGEESGASAGHAEQETLQRGEWTGELRHLNQAGQELVVESRWTLVRDEFGDPKTILVVNTDITDRKRIAEQFMRTQRLESIGALASGIAHDLNNVFAPILMATDLMADSDAADSAHILDMVRTTAQRGADMVKQVLMFVRGGASEMEPTCVDRLAHEVRRLMSETLPCTIQVSAQVAKDLPPVLGDPTQLHQLLVNLCVNARDAMPDGGELRLQLDEVALDESKAKENLGIKPGRFVRLVVADTGMGMTPEIRAKIFEPFFTTKEVGKGTGLGLSTVAAIVRSHGGFLEVESKVGRGTQFLIYLPVCEPLGAREEAPKDELPPGQGELIIVADDEHSVREITRLTLEVHNYRVMLANNGAEALSAFIQHREETALVITDIMMPMMNGRALIHALRQFDPQLPIVAFSAADRSNPLVGTLDEEGVPHLRKPATPHQLLTAVAEALRPKPPEMDLAAVAKSCSTHFSI